MTSPRGRKRGRRVCLRPDRTGPGPGPIDRCRPMRTPREETDSLRIGGISLAPLDAGLQRFFMWTPGAPVPGLRMILRGIAERNALRRWWVNRGDRMRCASGSTPSALPDGASATMPVGTRRAAGRAACTPVHPAGAGTDGAEAASPARVAQIRSRPDRGAGCAGPRRVRRSVRSRTGHGPEPGSSSTSALSPGSRPEPGEPAPADGGAGDRGGSGTARKRR